MNLTDRFDKLVGEISRKDVIENLKSDIVTLSEWLKNYDGDSRASVFYEKTKLLNDKKKELEKFESNINP